MIVATAILAVTFMASEVYRRNDFIFGDINLSPSIISASASLSPGLRAGKSVIENSSLFPDGAYNRSRKTRESMPMLSAMKDAESKLVNGDAVHIGHPCTRFVGAYNHLLSKDASEEEQEWASQHMKSMTMDEFAIELESNPEELYYENLFRPMSTVYFEEGEFQHDQVICQESTAVALKAISAYKMKSMPESFLDTPMVPDAHGSCADLSDDTIKIIERLYKRDYCIFGYEGLPSAVPTCSQAKMTRDALTQRYADCVAAEEQSGEEGDLIVHVWKP